LLDLRAKYVPLLGAQIESEDSASKILKEMLASAGKVNDRRKNKVNKMSKTQHNLYAERNDLVMLLSLTEKSKSFEKLPEL